MVNKGTNELVDVNNSGDKRTCVSPGQAIDWETRAKSLLKGVRR